MARASGKAGEARRWLGIALRSAHIAAVVLLGAQVLGAGGAAQHGAALTLVTGLALFASEWADGRIRPLEAAGLVVFAKLAAVGWVAFVAPGHRQAVFWGLLVASAVISHAPRGLRHWPRR